MPMMAVVTPVMLESDCAIRRQSPSPIVDRIISETTASGTENDHNQLCRIADPKDRHRQWHDGDRWQLPQEFQHGFNDFARRTDAHGKDAESYGCPAKCRSRRDRYIAPVPNEVMATPVALGK